MPKTAPTTNKSSSKQVQKAAGHLLQAANGMTGKSKKELQKAAGHILKSAR